MPPQDPLLPPAFEAAPIFTPTELYGANTPICNNYSGPESAEWEPQFSTLLNIIRIFCKENDISVLASNGPSATDILDHFFQQMRSEDNNIKRMMGYNTQSDLFFVSIKQQLENICERLIAPTVNKNTKKTVMSHLLKTLNLCPAGLSNGIKEAVINLSELNTTTQVLASFRRQIIEQFASQYVLNKIKNQTFERHVAELYFQYAARQGWNHYGYETAFQLKDAWEEKIGISEEDYLKFTAYFLENYSIEGQLRALLEKLQVEINKALLKCNVTPDEQGKIPYTDECYQTLTDDTIPLITELVKETQQYLYEPVEEIVDDQTKFFIQVASPEKLKLAVLRLLAKKGYFAEKTFELPQDNKSTDPFYSVTSILHIIQAEPFPYAYVTRTEYEKNELRGTSYFWYTDVLEAEMMHASKEFFTQYISAWINACKRDETLQLALIEPVKLMYKYNQIGPILSLLLEIPLLRPLYNILVISAIKYKRVDLFNLLKGNNNDFSLLFSAFIKEEAPLNVLHLAAQSGSLEMVQLVHETISTISPDFVNQFTRDTDTDVAFTPLGLAVKEGHEDIFNYLLPFTSSTYPHYKNKHFIDEHDCSYPPILATAIEYKHPKIVTFLLQNKELSNKLIYYKEKNTENNILHLAAQSDDTEIVEALLRYLKTNTNFVFFTRCGNSNGLTPLGIVAQRGNVEILNLFIKYKVDIDASGEGRRRITPLFAAAKEGKYKAVERLLEMGASPFIPSNYRTYTPKEIPVAIALENGNVQTVRCLLADNEVNSFVLNRDPITLIMDTPLFIAIKYKHVTLVEDLLTRGAKVNRPYFHAETPLYLAASIGNDEMVRAILNHDKTTINEPVASSGLSAMLGMKILAGLTRIAILPLLLGIAISSIVITSPLEFIGTPLLKKVSSFIDLSRQKLLDFMSACLMPKHFIDPTKSGYTPLMIAVVNKNLTVVETLLCAGADVNKGLPNGTTPLYLAYQAGNLDIMKMLLNHNANAMQQINQPKQPERNIIQLAVLEKKYDMIKIFAEHNVNLNGVTTLSKNKVSPYESPLVLAIKNNDPKMVRVLLETGKVDIHEKHRTQHPGSAPITPFQLAVAGLAADNEEAINNSASQKEIINQLLKHYAKLFVDSPNLNRLQNKDNLITSLNPDYKRRLSCYISAEASKKNLSLEEQQQLFKKITGDNSPMHFNFALLDTTHYGPLIPLPLPALSGLPTATPDDKENDLTLLPRLIK